MVETVGDDRCVVLGKVEIRQAGILDETVGDIDPEAVDATLEPEPEDVEELVAHLAVVPVEVGLLDGEQMEVPLPGVPSASVIRSQAGPPNDASQSFGGRSPSSPRPGRKM